MKREKVKIPPIYLRSRVQVDYLLKLLPNLPLDPERPVEVLIQERKAKRKPSLNAMMWAGPLRDIDPWKGTRVLVGSTTQLTDKGMRVYLEQVEAEAATEYGVQFTTREEWMGGMVA